VRLVTRGLLVEAVNWIPEAGATPLLRARYKRAPDEATQVSGILSTAICAAVSEFGRAGSRDSRDDDVGQSGTNGSTRSD
jgi:hypothetical protein